MDFRRMGKEPFFGGIREGRRMNTITEEQKARCAKVMEVFSEMHGEGTGIMILDAGERGYVFLGEDPYGKGIEEIEAIRDGRVMFERLWGAWWDREVLQLSERKGIGRTDWRRMASALSAEEREMIADKREMFLSACGL